MGQAVKSLKSTLWRLEQHLPEAARMALLCRRRSAYWRRAGVIFVHVPKAAGISVSKALYGRPLSHVPGTAIRHHCPDLWRDLPSFAILRDPVERAQSAWGFARAGGSDLAGVSPVAQAATARFDRFADFVEGWLGHADLTTADPMFRPQSSYVSDADGAVLVDHLFPLTALDQAQNWLEEVLARPIDLPHLNASTAPSDPVAAEVAERIREIYAADCALYTRLAVP